MRSSGRNKQNPRGRRKVNRLSKEDQKLADLESMGQGNCPAALAIKAEKARRKAEEDALAEARRREEAAKARLADQQKVVRRLCKARRAPKSVFDELCKSLPTGDDGEAFRKKVERWVDEELCEQGLADRATEIRVFGPDSIVVQDD